MKDKYKISEIKDLNIKKIIDLYKENNNLDYLLDAKDKRFLKGYLKSDGKVGGPRVMFLPDGRKLNKGFSLFSPNLTIHEERNNHHWDVIYQNPNGEFAYLYSLDKVQKSIAQKYKKVEEFEKVFPLLNKNLINGLYKKEFMALSLYTLVKTFMRIGSEIYFKKNKHQGLTTLQKNNILIKDKNVIFSFLGKGGVPQKIDLTFPEVYIKNLSERLKKVKKNEFVFCDDKKCILSEKDFHLGFKKYCKKEFYPHIVRSYYATKRVEDFLKDNLKPTKKEIRELYDDIAGKLGHKKFSKKDNSWEASHSVTVAHYISPKLVKKLQGKVYK